jgi:hypothetical protein
MSPERAPQGDYDSNSHSLYLVRCGFEPPSSGGKPLTPRRVTDFLSVAKWFQLGLHNVSYCNHPVWNDVSKSLCTASIFCLIFSVRRKSVVTIRPPLAEGNRRAHWIEYSDGSRASLDVKVKKEIFASSGILPRFAACPARSPVTVLSDADSRWWRVAFFGAFAKLQKRLLLSSCLFEWNNSAPTGRIFVEFNIGVIFLTC